MGIFDAGFVLINFFYDIQINEEIVADDKYCLSTPLHHKKSLVRYKRIDHFRRKISAMKKRDQHTVDSQFKVSYWVKERKNFTRDECQ